MAAMTIVMRMITTIVTMIHLMMYVRRLGDQMMELMEAVVEVGKIFIHNYSLKT
jgi:hypothetical protein